MKKALSLLIVVCLIAAMFPVTAFAAESGSCGENATWTLDGGTLTISGTGAIADYTESGSAPWYAKRAQVRTIVVEEGITSIGDAVFDHLQGLKENVLIGKLIPAGTGLEAYRAVEVKRAQEQQAPVEETAN